MGPFEKWVGRASLATLRIWGIEVKLEPPSNFLDFHLLLWLLDRRPGVSHIVSTLDMTSFNLLGIPTVEAVL